MGLEWKSISCGVMLQVRLHPRPNKAIHNLASHVWEVESSAVGDELFAMAHVRAVLGLPGAAGTKLFNVVNQQLSRDFDIPGFVEATANAHTQRLGRTIIN